MLAGQTWPKTVHRSSPEKSLSREGTDLKISLTLRVQYGGKEGLAHRHIRRPQGTEHGKGLLVLLWVADISIIGAASTFFLLLHSLLAL